MVGDNVEQINNLSRTISLIVEYGGHQNHGKVWNDGNFYNLTGGTVHNHHKFYNNSNGQLYNNGTIENNTSLSIFTNFGKFVNDVDGIVFIETGATMINDTYGEIDNYGTIDNYGQFINDGILNNYSDNTFNNYGTFENSGVINNPGTFTNYGLVVNTGEINNTGTLNNYGTILGGIVTIDIKPGSDSNCINNDGHGIIPVAILTTESFDAATVDPVTVTLDGAAARVKGKSGNVGSFEDVDGDGDLDLVIQIEDTDGTYLEGIITATLTGLTYEGYVIEGTDSLCIVP